MPDARSRVQEVGREYVGGIRDRAARDGLVLALQLRKAHAWCVEARQHALQIVAARVIPGQHELAIGEAQRRHELVAVHVAGGGAICEIGSGPGVGTLGQCREHDAGTIGAGGRTVYTLGKCHPHAAVGIHGYARDIEPAECASLLLVKSAPRRIRVGGRVSDECVHLRSVDEGIAAVAGIRVLNGIGLAPVCRGDLPPRDVDRTGGRVYGGNRSLRQFLALAENLGLAPSGAAVGRDNRLDLRSRIVLRSIEFRIEKVNIAAAEGLAVYFASGRASCARDVHCDPRFVEELSGIATFDQGGINVSEPVAVGRAVAVLHQDRRIAVSTIILILECSHENSTGGSGAAVKHQAAVVKKAVGSSPHGWVGGYGELVQRRSCSYRRRILRVSWQQRAFPGFAAVQGGVYAEPRIAQYVGRLRVRNVDGAVVVGPGKQVLRVAAGNRHGRLILALQVGVTRRPYRARDHVYVLPCGRGGNLANCGGDT